MIFAISMTVAPTPERILLSLSSFSIMSMEFRKAIVMRNTETSSLRMDLCNVVTIMAIPLMDEA